MKTQIPYVIHKHKLELTDTPKVTLQVGAKILSVQLQNDGLVLWEAHPVIEGWDTKAVNFLIVGTGHEVNEVLAGTFWQHISTVQQGNYVWHVFCEYGWLKNNN